MHTYIALVQLLVFFLFPMLNFYSENTYPI